MNDMLKCYQMYFYAQIVDFKFFAIFVPQILFIYLHIFKVYGPFYE